MARTAAGSGHLRPLHVFAYLRVCMRGCGSAAGLGAGLGVQACCCVLRHWHVRDNRQGTLCTPYTLQYAAQRGHGQRNRQRCTADMVFSARTLWRGACAVCVLRPESVITRNAAAAAAAGRGPAARLRCRRHGQPASSLLKVICFVLDDVRFCTRFELSWLRSCPYQIRAAREDQHPALVQG